MDPSQTRVYVSVVDGSTHRSDADRELSDLRARAYGPDPRIDGDPAALARSRNEAEDSASPVKTGWWRSLWRGAIERWWSPLAWVAGVIVLVGGVGAASFLSAPRPDATLRPSAVEADSRLLAMLAEDFPQTQVSLPTLRAYDSYRGLEIWTGTNEFDSPCLIAVNRANDTISELRCTPSPAELILDVSSVGDEYGGLPGDGIVRFIHRGDTVDVYLFLMSGAG